MTIDTTPWMRYVSLQVGSLFITSDQLDIEFTIKGSNTSDANTADIIIWNLSRKNRDSIGPDQEVLLRAGYVGDIGDIFSGKVKMTSETRDQGDMGLKISAITQGYATGRPVVKYPVGTPLESIVSRAFIDSTIAVQCLSGCQGASLESEYTTDPNAAADLEYCAKLINGNDTKYKSVKYYVEAAGGYFVSQNYVRGSEATVLSSETGLIETVPETPDDGSYTRTIRCGFNHRIGTDGQVKLSSQDSSATGAYKIVEYSHKCEGTEFETECKVKPL